MQITNKEHLLCMYNMNMVENETDSINELYPVDREQLRLIASLPPG